jgi:hypothetical protein
MKLIDIDLRIKWKVQIYKAAGNNQFFYIGGGEGFIIRIWSHIIEIDWWWDSL